MTIRNQIELEVKAINKTLAEKVATMTLVDLLRNCHPLHRADYTRILFKNGLLTKIEAEEFTKII